MSQRPRILVVGAGPTGLTAAVELARRGYRPRIVDRNDGPTPLSKAVGISARSLELLEPSGATGRLLAEGLRIPHGCIHFAGRTLGALRRSEEHTSELQSLMRISYAVFCLKKKK